MRVNRRQFLRGAAAIALLPGMTRAGLITQAGPKYFPSQGGGGGGSVDYDFGAITHVVDPAAVSSGTGSEGSPFTVTQAMAFNPSGAHAHLEWLPGAVSVTLDMADPRKPKIAPAHSGTEANPLIWSCRNKAFNTATEGDRTRLVRASGFGSMLGICSSSLAYDEDVGHVRFDGFDCTGWLGDDEGEIYNYNTRGSENVWFTRGRAGFGDQTTLFNCGSFFTQNANNIKCFDVVFEKNLGSSGANGSHTEHYATSDLEIAYCLFGESGAGGINVKGEGPPGMTGGRFHHNVFERCDQMCIQFFAYDAPTDKASGHWFYQNIIKPSATRAAVAFYRTLGNDAPRYAYVVNNTIAGPIGNGSGDSGAIFWRPFFDSGFGTNLHVRNNLFYNLVRAYSGEDGASFTDHNASFSNDRNHFDTITTLMREGGSNRNLSYVRSTFSQETNSVESSAGMTNAAAGDYTLTESAAARTTGRDELQLLGGATSDTIPAGAHITAFGATAETFGPRYT